MSPRSAPSRSNAFRRIQKREQENPQSPRDGLPGLQRPPIKAGAPPRGNDHLELIFGDKANSFQHLDSMITFLQLLENGLFQSIRIESPPAGDSHGVPDSGRESISMIV